MSLSTANQGRLAFAIAVLVAVIAGAIWFYQTVGRFNTFQVLTEDSVSGLIAGAPVEFHGVDVGRVTEVELTSPSAVRILLEVEKDAPVNSATVATVTSRGVATRGFTGYVYVYLENTGGDQSLLNAAPGARYPQISSAPSRSVSLDTAISQVNQNVQSLTELLRTMLDEDTIESFKLAVGNLQEVTRMLAENEERLNTIIANTEQASGQLGPLLDSSSDTVHALQQVSHMLTGNQSRLNAIIVNTEQASRRLGPLLDSSSDSVNALQLQVLPEAYRSVTKLNQLSDSLNRLTNKIDRNPAILLRGSTPPPLGPGETE